MKPIFILNGPNLNLLGEREPAIYGSMTLAMLEQQVADEATTLGFEVSFRQTNHEGVLIDWVQEARNMACALILNAGAYTHTSIGILDALRALSIPVVEVHLSNIFKRELYRHHSYVSPGATGVICGFGPQSYSLAIKAVASLLGQSTQPSSVITSPAPRNLNV